jgi:hypothetical protein
VNYAIEHSKISATLCLDTRVVTSDRELERLRAAVSAGGTRAIIKLIQVPGQGEEALMRGQIVLAELTLGREKYFEGHGLVDLMRAIQSV